MYLIGCFRVQYRCIFLQVRQYSKYKEPVRIYRDIAHQNISEAIYYEK